MIFNKGHGFNIYGGFDNFFGIGANYIYESTSSIKWAVLTGFDTGFGLPSLSGHGKYTFRYNLGVRFRKNRHAISFITKIPLFATPPREDVGYYHYEKNTKIYPGVNALVRYTYFFGL